MLEITQLCLQAGGFQVDRVSITVAAGSCHALVGETGSGKTLVLETVAGLRRARSGVIHWLGRDITLLPPEQRRLAYVPQDLALFPHMTVRENIEYGLRMQHHIPEETFAGLGTLTRDLGISHLLERSTRNLSGGERQRVALARALAPGATLLLLDEPFSALHEAMRKELWLLLKTLQSQLGITILLVTHDMEEAFFLADSVTFVSHGRVVQSGEKREVYSNPVNVEAAKFFGVQNWFPAEVVGATSDRVRLSCSGLGTTLEVMNRGAEPWQRKSSLFIGIRAEDVIVNEGPFIEGTENPSGSNSVLCTVQHIYPKRNGQILLVQPVEKKGRENLMKADVAGDRPDLMRAGSIGQEVMITLPAESLFVFAEEREGLELVDATAHMPL